MKEKILNFIKAFAKNKKRLLIAVGVVVLAIFLTARKNANQEPRAQTQTATAETGTIISTVSASGSVVGANIQNVTTKASGVVKAVYVEDGQEVVKGQKIAEIELDSEGSQNYASVYSSYLSAVKSVNSANNSYRSTQASLAVVYDDIQGHDEDETLEMKEQRTKAEVANDNAYDGVKTAQAQLYSASLSYSESSPVIIAPAAGVINNLTIAEGLQLGSSSSDSGSIQSQRVATIASGGKPIISVNISEIDVPVVEVGQKATVTFDSIEDKTFTGSVVAIDKLGSSTSGVTTYPALIQLDTDSEQILVNMAVTADIITNSKTDVLMVLSTAITTNNGESTVVVVRDGKEITTPVEIGIASDTETEIISGISEGDEVVTGIVSLEDIEFGGSSFGGGFGGGGAVFRAR